MVVTVPKDVVDAKAAEVARKTAEKILQMKTKGRSQAAVARKHSLPEGVALQGAGGQRRFTNRSGAKRSFR